MRLNTFRIIREIELETLEDEEILLSSHKLHNTLKLFIHDLEQHIKYEDDESARHYLGVLQSYLKQNDIEKLF